MGRRKVSADNKAVPVPISLSKKYRDMLDFLSEHFKKGHSKLIQNLIEKEYINIKCTVGTQDELNSIETSNTDNENGGI